MVAVVVGVVVLVGSGAVAVIVVVAAFVVCCSFDGARRCAERIAKQNRQVLGTRETQKLYFALVEKRRFLQHVEAFWSKMPGISDVSCQFGCQNCVCKALLFADI